MLLPDKCMAITTDTGFIAEVDTNALDRLLSIQAYDGKREKEIKNLIDKALNNARKRLSEEAKVLLKNDKRQSWRAVKRSLYRNILGGNVSIFSRRRAGARATVPPSRRGRTADTERYESYLGADRGFILRIMNAGNTGRERVATHMDGHTIRMQRIQRPRNRVYKSDVIGYRGVWNEAGGWFSRVAANAMGAAAIELSELLCEELTKEINKY